MTDQQDRVDALRAELAGDLHRALSRSPRSLFWSDSEWATTLAERLLAAGWVKAPAEPTVEQVVVQLGRLLDAVQLIRMDTPEDRERHDRLVATFREYEDRARAALRGGGQRG